VPLAEERQNLLEKAVTLQPDRVFLPCSLGLFLTKDDKEATPELRSRGCPTSVFVISTAGKNLFFMFGFLSRFLSDFVYQAGAPSK
jgi:hypothetical protein